MCVIMVIFPIAVCDAHHFKDEVLYYRFRNDDKAKSSQRFRDRLTSKKRKRNSLPPAGGMVEDAGGSTGDDQNESGGSWDSSSDRSHTPQGTPELDE